MIAEDRKSTTARGQGVFLAKVINFSIIFLASLALARVVQMRSCRNMALAISRKVAFLKLRLRLKRLPDFPCLILFLNLLLSGDEHLFTSLISWYQPSYPNSNPWL